MRATQLSAYDVFFFTVLQKTAYNSRMYCENVFIQHGTVSCLLHSIAVAYYSYRIALKLSKWFPDLKSLIRGALLHDYFLYDWHIPDKNHKLHGFRHPKTALCNAQQDFDLNCIEEDIVKNHMFPLTFYYLPKHKETFLVSLVDKACSVYEFFISCPYSEKSVYGMYQKIQKCPGFYAAKK